MLPGAFKFSGDWVPVIKKLPETGMTYTVATIHLKDGRVFKQAVIIEGMLTMIRGETEIPFGQDDVAEVIATHDKWDWQTED